MEIVKTLVDVFLHIDKNLVAIIAEYGTLTYGIMFLIVFMETGFVVTPFLPGDSLLFAAGALAAMGSFSILWLYALLLVASIAGDTINYWMGHFIGPKVFDGGNKLFKKEYLEEGERFYEKHGGKAIILARFIPIVRTFAPFVAGVSKMHYGNFIMYNVVGGFLWTTAFLFAGYLFGNIPVVKENFHYMVVGIIVFSVVPIVLEFLKKKKMKQVTE